nr:hypothetical protein GCM10020092_094120 [Actinoplanes digitatis]
MAQRMPTQVGEKARTVRIPLETGTGPRGAASAAVGATSDAMPMVEAAAAARAPIRRPLLIPNPPKLVSYQA